MPLRNPCDLPLKLPGHCSQCHKKLWDPKDGAFRRGATGKDIDALRPGKRACFLLLDGTTMDLTMCDDCVAAPDLDRLWKQTLVGWRSGNVDAVRPDVAKKSWDNLILAFLFAVPWSAVDVEEKLKVKL